MIETRPVEITFDTEEEVTGMKVITDLPTDDKFCDTAV